VLFWFIGGKKMGELKKIMKRAVKGDAIRFIEALMIAKERNAEEEYPNRHFDYAVIYPADAVKIFEKVEEKFGKWSKLPVRKRREIIKEAVKKALSIYLNPDFLVDKTFQSYKDYLEYQNRLFLKKENDLKEFEKAIILLKWKEKVGVHPSPEVFRPLILKRGWDKKRNKPVVIFEVADEDIYESSKHYNHLEVLKFEQKETDKGVYFFIKYHLYRQALEFGRHREFAFIFGIDDGSPFVERVSPSCNNIDEAIEYLKPAEVKRAEKEGRKVFRQGDVFFVELKSKRKTIFDYTLPRNHIPIKENGKIIIKHHEHSYLVLPHPHFKPVVRKTVEGRYFD
jgi:hypothetical protein